MYPCCRYVSEFESTLIDGAVTESDADYASRLVGNPIHAFNLMRRFSIDIPNIEKDIKEDDWKGWLEISQVNKTIIFTTFTNNTPL